MIDRPGRGLLRRGWGGGGPPGGAGGGGGGGGGQGGGESGSSEVFLQRAMAASARGRAARQKKSIAHIHIWRGSWGHAPSNGGCLPERRAAQLDHPAPARARGRREAVYFHLRHGGCALNASLGRKRHIPSVHRAQPGAQAAAARCNRSRTPSQSGVAGGVSIQI